MQDSAVQTSTLQPSTVRTLPTVEDVARVAGVSRQTVSNVLNSPEIVKQTTTARVVAAIAQLGYRPHASARRLRTRKSSTIGVRLDPMTNGISGSLLDRFLHALTEQAADRDLRIMLFTARGFGGEIDAFSRLRDGADVDAFVLTSTVHNDPRTAWLLDHDFPFVTFGRPSGVDDLNDPLHPWVDVDGFSGARQATQHAIACGARRVGYIGFDDESTTALERRAGWASESADQLGFGGTELDALSLAVVDGVPQGNAAALRLLRLPDAPDALVCASDSLALGAMMAAASIGRTGLPVIGYDNTPVADAVGLSSVDQPLDLVAESALELLFGESGSTIISRTHSATDPMHRLLTPTLVVRQSTQLARVEDSGSPVAGNHKES
ncbi:MAG: LacI family DNA-binding transcriptional regulator [Terrimesophilobacter sp.]